MSNLKQALNCLRFSLKAEQNKHIRSCCGNCYYDYDNNKNLNIPSLTTFCSLGCQVGL